MNHPKIKHPLLCRTLIYVLVISALLLPVAIVIFPSFIPTGAKIGLVIAILLVFLVLIFKNMLKLMYIDARLAVISSHNSARKSWSLPKGASAERIEKRTQKLGKSYTPLAIEPIPESLTYRFITPLTVYYCGIEIVSMTYRTDLLTRDGLFKIMKSARENSEALKETKKALFNIKLQKGTPLSRVTLPLIFAEKVEGELSCELFDILTKEADEGMETAFMPCIIDLEKRKVVFDSLRDPYVGFSYPAKNRGYKLINKTVFGGCLRPRNSSDTLPPLENHDPEMSLWRFIREMGKDLNEEKIKTRKRFESMAHGEIIYEDGFVYIKWQDCGVWLFAEKDEESESFKVDNPESFDYPKYGEIPEDIRNGIKDLCEGYFTGLGYSVRFISSDGE